MRTGRHKDESETLAFDIEFFLQTHYMPIYTIRLAVACDLHMIILDSSKRTSSSQQ